MYATVPSVEPLFVSADAPASFASPKSSTFTRPFFRQEQVRRLDVPVHDPLAWAGASPAAACAVSRRLRPAAAAPAPLPQRLPVAGHGDEQPPVSASPIS